MFFAYSATLRSDSGFSIIYRLLVMPLFLFSGAFFPISNLPPVLEWLARLTPLWHGVDLTRMLVLGQVRPAGTGAPHLPGGAEPGRLVARGAVRSTGGWRSEMALVTAAVARDTAHPRTTGWEIVRRNFIVYRASWLVFLTGFLEPVLYLFSIGIGVGQLVTGFEFHGHGSATPPSSRRGCWRPRR